MRLNQDGYLEIVRRGPLRWKRAHRAYVNRQMMESLGRELRPDEEVHHLCRNRACWPPTDGHLLVLDERIHHAIDAGREPHWKHRKRRKAKGQGVNVGKFLGILDKEPGDESLSRQ